MIPDIERELLGILLTSHAKATRSVVAELGLTADHFQFDRDQATFDAILSLIDRGADHPDPLLVAEEMGGDEATQRFLLEVAEQVNSPHANPVPFAERVIKRAEWRRLSVATAILGEAVKQGDEAKLAEAREQLTQDRFHRRSMLTPADLQGRLEQIMEGAAAKEFPFPFRRLNDLTAGGLGRKEHHAIAGHSSHGKSVWCDQLLRYWGGTVRAHLYTNEMNEDSRLIRQVNTDSSVTFADILKGNLTEDQKAKLRERAKFNVVFGITDATGWTAREISNDIRLNRWDVAAVDMLHNVAPGPNESTQEQTLTNASRVLTETARQANCLVVSVSHLNESRNMGTQKPRPTLGDIRGSGMIKNSADSVAFIWRGQDTDRGLPEPEGEVILAKVRNGVPGWVDVRLESSTLEFAEVDKVHYAPFGEAA